jgi:hypothetical protein
VTKMGVGWGLSTGYFLRREQECSVLTALLLPVHIGNDICQLPLGVGRGHVI